MSLRRLSDIERRDWVRLVRTPQIGPLTFDRLIARYGNATAAIEALPDIASRVAKGRRIALPPITAIEDEIAATFHFGARLVAGREPDFPKLLAALDPPPPLLTRYGDADLARSGPIWPGLTRSPSSVPATPPPPAARSRATWPPSFAAQASSPSPASPSASTAKPVHRTSPAAIASLRALQGALSWSRQPSALANAFLRGWRGSRVAR